MKIQITDYEHRPGENCGSTALRNMLLYYCGLDISEALTFGWDQALNHYISSSAGQMIVIFVFTIC